MGNLYSTRLCVCVCARAHACFGGGWFFNQFITQCANFYIYVVPVRSPLLQLEEERKDHDGKMKKMEAEMEQVFEMKVKEKRNKIKESEADVSPPFTS